MSNRLNIQQETITVKHTGCTSKQVAMFDNYSQAALEIEVDFDDDMDLLRWVIKQEVLLKDWIRNAKELLNFVFEQEKGISIEGDLVQLG